VPKVLRVPGKYRKVKGVKENSGRYRKMQEVTWNSREVGMAKS
jgi:hypothetical protein